MEQDDVDDDADLSELAVKLLTTKRCIFFGEDMDALHSVAMSFYGKCTEAKSCMNVAHRCMSRSHCDTCNDRWCSTDGNKQHLGLWFATDLASRGVSNSSVWHASVQGLPRDFETWMQRTSRAARKWYLKRKDIVPLC